MMGPDSVQDKTADRTGDDALKSSLMAKYRTSLVEKLSPRDLEELQFFLKNKFDADRTINPDYLIRFMFKLREYFHEETLTREMASIEALVERLQPEDLPAHHSSL
jgi:hypothetical protein